MTAKRLSDSPRDRVLRDLSTQEAKLSRGDLAKLKQAELDKILDTPELEGLVNKNPLEDWHVWQAEAFGETPEEMMG
jgi:hypothetical protein